MLSSNVLIAYSKFFPKTANDNRLLFSKIEFVITTFINFLMLWKQCGVVGNIGLSASSESIYQTKHSRSRGSSIRHRQHRVSSRRNKENGSGSVRRKNSSKKSNTLLVVDNVKSLNCNNSSSSNNGSNDDKILKVSFPRNESTQSKSHVVSFGDMPIVVKTIPTTKDHQSVMMEQEDTLRDQSYSRKCEKLV